MPFFLLAAGVAVWLLARERSAHAQALPAPSWQQYMPPIQAPDAFRIAYAQAMASGNPIQMAAVAQSLMQQGQVQLAQALAAQYQRLTNNWIPGVPPMPGITMAAAGAAYDPRVANAIALLVKARRIRKAQQQARNIAALLRLRQIVRSS